MSVSELHAKEEIPLDYYQDEVETKNTELVELFLKIDNEMDNITDNDKVILQYLLEHTFWQFIRDNYDGEFKL